MPYDEYLADCIRTTFNSKHITFEEKKMMGGICFMVNDKMCAGVVKNNLMARVAPEVYEEALSKKGCQPMDFTGRPMKGFVFVEPEALDNEDALGKWIQLCLDFNPRANSSKKQ